MGDHSNYEPITNEHTVFLESTSLSGGLLDSLQATHQSQPLLISTVALTPLPWQCPFISSGSVPQEFRGFAGGSDPMSLRRLRSRYHLGLSSGDVMRLEDVLLRSLSDMAGRWRPRLLTTWTSVC